jgi:uncharacterized protein (UPF0335 family)
MESKEFEYDGKRYRIERYADSEIRVFEHLRGEQVHHLYGEQKELIVKKLDELIQAVQGQGFDERVIKYVKDYIDGTNRDASHNTRSLGKVLLDHLP